MCPNFFAHKHFITTSSSSLNLNICSCIWHFLIKWWFFSCLRSILSVMNHLIFHFLIKFNNIIIWRSPNWCSYFFSFSIGWRRSYKIIISQIKICDSILGRIFVLRHTSCVDSFLSIEIFHKIAHWRISLSVCHKLLLHILAFKLIIFSIILSL